MEMYFFHLCSSPNNAPAGHIVMASCHSICSPCAGTQVVSVTDMQICLAFDAMDDRLTTEYLASTDPRMFINSHWSSVIILEKV